MACITPYVVTAVVCKTVCHCQDVLADHRLYLVIAVYREATRLVQRLKAKQIDSEDSSLMESLPRELEASFALGSMIVQSQYDHDVRRFGDPYAHGDAIAREQIKDIVITLQKAVIAHLHEAFMEEVKLDLHFLKETSDNSRVDATVCLGQLYQRMSTAETAMKKGFKHELDQSDIESPGSVPRSNSQSTHSSGEGGQSTASYTTYSSRPGYGHYRNPSNGPPPHGAVRMPFETLPSRMPQAGSSAADKTAVPAQPFLMQDPERNGGSQGLSTDGEDLQMVDRPDDFAIDRTLPYNNAVTSSRDDLPDDLSAGVTTHDCQDESPYHRHPLVQSFQLGWRQDVPRNPNYSTLEVVERLEAQGQPSQSPLTQWQPPHPWVQQNNPQTSCSQALDPWQQLLGRGVPSALVSTPTSHPNRVATTSSIVRRLSVRSSHSASSPVGGFSLRRALPPGILHAVQIRPTAKGKMQHDSSLQLEVVRSDLKLPSESNLAGFCKGAVRQQLGSRKKGFVLDHRHGDNGEEWFFRCTKCSFVGPAAISTALPSGGRGPIKREKMFDTKVRTSPGGIQYRWLFLAKSHVSNQTSKSDLSNINGRYGCYFCIAEGGTKGWLDDKQWSSLGTSGEASRTERITPTFKGLHDFIAHLETHRLSDRLPGLIVAKQMNCIVGRVASESEDFELNLPHWQNVDMAELF
ncbi:hypothetical protein LTR10_018599 [Elasticomyces elasticus]|uniref:Uncharacterized protein n=1 Tax=Exophiala sideris TaxID=1016849 RepID=A0ABR0J091_9EURO|nr:hypothetical protein LTR10_018599 [Elasticomyces elasticus]KAK5023238.1 hypothetical protein LTS07_009461 [Exophiala sideris]KAK5028610.1 hypothetical protein LTR13_009062 [Exophiala sideris]KAK5052988.1 hypothetical protein LTR69_009558 [Exophiala sideris]KAK5178728.1 hypothetical protein LTR44_008843 [Eurotiomycetes sp. CCFEE 6388]